MHSGNQNLRIPDGTVGEAEGARGISSDRSVLLPERRQHDGSSRGAGGPHNAVGAPELPVGEFHCSIGQQSRAVWTSDPTVRL